ncbi:DnaJsubfamily B member 11 [Sesamum alatum]|uniref:DnaJsubfamily B member 11 n=1 Tax=Sesamum alatum TaxID=300844 RepID=A0AAE1Y2K8_9LAMI|nr:DnaJsubfamily B member 11 [Sesamum alatum]
MSDDDEKACSIDLARPEEEALRLKALAEEKYTSGDLKSAMKYAKRAHKLHPSLEGLPEMLTAFKIIRTAAKPGSGSSSGAQNSTPDYYKILQVEPFSHINTIKKQYKKLALALHPDKNPFVASEEAFKMVGEASRVLSDRIRRKEYDLRLRIAMQSKAAEEVGLGVEGSAETFWTACSTCRLLHQFERKYLGHNLMCPRCKKTFKATEVEEDSTNEGDIEMNEGGKARVSARIRERVAKGDNLGIMEKCGLGVKRKISSVGEVLERSRMKMARNVNDDDGLLKDFKLKRTENVQKSGEHDRRGNEGLRLKKVEDLVREDGSGYQRSRDTGVINELSPRRVGGKARDGVEKASKSGGFEIAESERTKRAKAREEETMTLSEIQMLVKKKKKKLVDGKLIMKRKEVNAEQLKAKEKEGENEKEQESEKNKEKEREEDREKEEEKERGDEGEKEKGEDKEREKEKGEEEKEKEENKEREMVTLREKTYSRRVSKYRNLEVVQRTSKNLQDSAMERDRSSSDANLEGLQVEKANEKETEIEDMRDVLLVEKEKGDGNEKGKEMEDMREVLLVEKGNGNNKEKEMEQMREKRERRRVSKYGNLDIIKRKTSKNHADSDVKRLITKKKGNLEIVAVEDSDFHDFDKDRRERSFKKGQVWAVYDDDDGMPRHYALIDEIVSVNPFEVTLSWLQFQNNGDDELISWQKTGFHVSCGSFKVSKRVSIKYLNLFSHVVDCERAAREMYRIHPTKGSVWALYSNTEGTNQRDKNNRRYDIVVALSSYSDVHGLSIAHLEKVSGFRTVFKRREVGANAVICLAKDDVKLFSHQIPAKKLSGAEASGLPKDCWELDPASLAPPLLIG